jgi:hypothetical protein
LDFRKTAKNSTGKPIQKITMYKVRHPKTDVNRLYVERREGKRGLLKIEATYKRGITNTAECLKTK